MCRGILHALGAFALLLSAAASVTAAEPFVVEDIRVEGAERLEIGTVLNYLPVRAGETFTEADGQRAVRALYDTGLFRDVSLFREGSTLVVEVDERPAISEINLEGNFSIDEDDLLTSLEQIGLERGRIFDRSVLAQINQVLRDQLYSLGKYGMELTTEVRELDRDRVAIDITLREGKSARIREVKIIGNETFDDDELKDLMESGVPGSLSLFSSADEYSRTKLEGDLEEIRSYYLDRGYANFTITSSQVTITPDRKDIYITINLEEGERFRVGKVELEGELPVPREELLEQIVMSEGDVFSRKSLVDSRTGISDRLAEAGYAFANINVQPQPDESVNIIDVRFLVEPGKKVYVNRISFVGQLTTEDSVYRREMRQFEGALYSPRAVDRSRVRLQRLPQVQSVEVNTRRIPGREDLVDIEYSLKERPTGSLSLGAGVSSQQGVVFNVGFQQRNLLGTGKDLTASLDTSQDNRRLIVRYTNPFYTDWGVSRSWRVEYEESDPRDFLDTRSFFADRLSTGVDYGIPISEFNTISVGIGIQGQRFGTTPATEEEILEFLDENGSEFTYLEGSIGWRHDTRNRTIFAERGSQHRVNTSFVVPGADLEFYKVGYSFEFFKQLTNTLVLSPRVDIDVGDGYGETDGLPFFERFFAGGIRSVRGYEGGSLGPEFSNGDPSGGDLRTVGSLELVFPPPYSPDSASTRLSLFYDFGTVYEDVQAFDSDELRTSLGVSFNWRSPVGPLSFSLAKPLNNQPGDDTQRFQFTLGTLF